MNLELIPWKETMLIFLLIGLSMSLSNLKLKDTYVRDITTHPWIRFLIIFLTAFMIFSLNIHGNYSITTRAIVSALITIVIQTFLAANTILFLLGPPVSPEET